MQERKLQRNYLTNLHPWTNVDQGLVQFGKEGH